jgi:hypothetical protein
MDPYLEAHWGDVPTRLVTYASDQLKRYLPSSLRARVEERVFVELQNGRGRAIYPDVQVIERPFAGDRNELPARDGGPAISVAEPIVIQLEHEPKTEKFIEIRDVSSGGRIVTVIEFVSPANKLPGEGRTLYRRKQDELYDARVNSVEIDLIRTGHNGIAAAPERLPPEYRTPYRICVRRATRRAALEVYRAALREPLPTIRIPLRETDQDVPLALQALIEQCYENGGYDDIDYSQPPIPPLEPDDARWAEAVLRERGLRT